MNTSYLHYFYINYIKVKLNSPDFLIRTECFAKTRNEISVFANYMGSVLYNDVFQWFTNNFCPVMAI
jgi:hypothetical protein